MKTTARILTGLGTGVLVLGLAAFRDPGAFRSMQDYGAPWNQTRITPTSIIASSLQSFVQGSAPGYGQSIPYRSAWSPWNSSSAYTRYANDDDDRGWKDRDRDRRWRDNRRRDRDDDRGGWNRHHDNGRHKGWYKHDRDDDNRGGWWNRGQDRNDRDGWWNRDQDRNDRGGWWNRGRDRDQRGHRHHHDDDDDD